MDDEFDRPKSTSAITIGQTLDDLSVEELIERTRLLKAEIARVEAEIINKKSTKSDAEMVFRI